MYHVPNVNEQAQCDRLENLCGGAAKAEQLQHIWKNTIGIRNRESAFLTDARKAGFSIDAISLFLTM